MNQRKWTTVVGRWMAVAIDVWLGSRFGFWRGFAFSIGITLVLLGGVLVGKERARAE